LYLDDTKVIILILWRRTFQLEYWRTFQLVSTIVKAEQNIVFRAKISTDELAKVHQCTVRHIKAEEDLLERHSDKMAKHLQNNEGVWLSTSWLIFTLVVLAISYLAVILWAIYKR